MNYLDVLVEVRRLLDNPANRITTWFAKDANGQECDANSPNAVCWCLYGALYKNANIDKNNPEYYKEDYYQACTLAASKVEDTAHKLYDSKNIVYLNNVLRHEEILNILDTAIVEAKQAVE